MNYQTLCNTAQYRTIQGNLAKHIGVLRTLFFAQLSFYDLLKQIYFDMMKLWIFYEKHLSKNNLTAWLAHHRKWMLVVTSNWRIALQKNHVNDHSPKGRRKLWDKKSKWRPRQVPRLTWAASGMVKLTNEDPPWPKEDGKEDVFKEVPTQFEPLPYLFQKQEQSKATFYALPVSSAQLWWMSERGGR